MLIDSGEIDVFLHYHRAKLRHESTKTGTLTGTPEVEQAKRDDWLAERKRRRGDA